MKLDFGKIKLILAQKENESHKKGVWEVFNENIEFSHLTSKTIPYEEHCKWWKKIFDNEYIYIIMYQSDICGYIRLAKERTENKEKYEISIALTKKSQNFGIGSFAYQIFENQIKKIGISKIISNTEIKNIAGQKFFEKNKFTKSQIKYIKNL